MTSEATYRRGPMDWALWRRFTEGRSGALKDPPNAFRTRTKKFLDLDREPLTDVYGKPAFAFGDGEKPGKGSDRAFTHFDGTCLAIAHDMMDSGLKQTEIIFVLKHSRPAIRHFYDRIMKGNDPVARTARLPKDYPEWPTYKDESGVEKVDWRVFLVLKRSEFTGRYGERIRAGRPEVEPEFNVLDFCCGVDDLRAFLNEEMWRFRKAYIGEIAHPARRLAAWLEKAPEVKRGRA